MQLRSADRASYIRAAQLLAPTQVPLESAVAQFVEAARIPRQGILVEAARFFARRHPVSLPKRSIPELVDEFLADKTAKGKSECYLSDLRYRCRRFADQPKFDLRMAQQ